MKLLLENWRKHLKEGAEDEEGTPTRGGTSQDLRTFAHRLNDIAANMEVGADEEVDQKVDPHADLKGLVQELVDLFPAAMPVQPGAGGDNEEAAPAAAATATPVDGEEMKALLAKHKGQRIDLGLGEIDLKKRNKLIITYGGNMGCTIARSVVPSLARLGFPTVVQLKELYPEHEETGSCDYMWKIVFNTRIQY